MPRHANRASVQGDDLTRAVVARLRVDEVAARAVIGARAAGHRHGAPVGGQPDVPGERDRAVAELLSRGAAVPRALERARPTGEVAGEVLAARARAVGVLEARDGHDEITCRALPARRE